MSGFQMGLDPLPSRPGPGRNAGGGLHSGYDTEMADLLGGTALPSGARFTTVAVHDDPRLSRADRVAYLRAWVAHFAEQRWPQLLWYYAHDEPAPQDDPLVRDQAALTRAAGRLPLLVTTFRPALFERRGHRRAGDGVHARLARAPAVPDRSAAGHRASAPSLRPEQQLWWYQSCMFHGCDGPPEGPPSRGVDDRVGLLHHRPLGSAEPRDGRPRLPRAHRRRAVLRHAGRPGRRTGSRGATCGASVATATERSSIPARARSWAMRRRSSSPRSG